MDAQRTSNGVSGRAVHQRAAVAELASICRA